MKGQNSRTVLVKDPNLPQEGGTRRLRCPLSLVSGKAYTSRMSLPILPSSFAEPGTVMSEGEIRAALTHLGYPEQAPLLGQYWDEAEIHRFDGFSAMGVVLTSPTPDLSLVRGLLALGHHPHDDATSKTSSLRLACHLEEPEILDIFLTHGVDPNRPNKTGVLLLTELFSFRLHSAILERLLEAGADPDRPNFRDESPRDFLQKHRMDAVGQFAEIEALVGARKNRKNLETILPPGQEAPARLRI